MTARPFDDSFRLLYFSPNPEDGERVCVAVLAAVGRHWFVEFDENFAKLKAVAREKDVEFVRGVIGMLQADLDRNEFSSLMARFEPQFQASEARRLLVPWSSEVGRKLRDRFLVRGRFREDKFERQHEESIQNRIGDFVGELVPRAKEFVITGLRPSRLVGEALGHELRMLRPVAQAFVGRTRAVLIDGVDTTLKPSSGVIEKANRIAYTFWKYGSVLENPGVPSSAPRKIYRVGIVFDGKPSANMLREYSLHQFQKDADLAIESTDREGIGKMRFELEGAIEDIRL